jgi:hypothetical protein
MKIKGFQHPNRKRELSFLSEAQLEAIIMKSLFKQLAGRKRPEIAAPNISTSSLPHETAVGAARQNIANAVTWSTQQSSTVQTAPTRIIDSTTDSDTADRSDGVVDTTYHPISQGDLFPHNQTHGLRVLYQPANALVDIIFVHGLTGDSYNTWLQPTSGIYWPVHLLSKDIT